MSQRSNQDGAGASVSIAIPTYKRPDTLKRLLESIQADLSASGRERVSIIVADNDPKRSAERCVLAFAGTVDCPVIYTHAPEPGVSNARNAAMAKVKSRYVMFLDDDMEVVTPYLDPIIATSQQLGTALTFAPAIAKLPKGTERLYRWLAPLFSRTLSGPTRLINETLGTGGCLVDLKGMTLPDPVFDPAMNETGGEDDVFFAAIIDQGGTVGWCADAKAWEHVPEHRATTHYLWRRHFAFGQTPTRDAAEHGLAGLPGVLKWMAVGGLQSLVHAPLYVALKVLSRPAQVHHLGRLAQGIGKIFWWDSISPRLYGQKAR